MPDNQHPKADILNRFIAKFIDLLIVAVLYEFSSRIGFITGFLYLLIADGLLKGRSPGKWLIGLQTYVPMRRDVCTFKESIIRNSSLAVAYLLFLIPYIGWLFTAAILSLEGLLIIGNAQSLRIGDEAAGTQVLEYRVLDAEVRQ